MIFFSEYEGVTFRWSEVDQRHLHDWFDDFPAGELKSSIVKVVRMDAKNGHLHPSLTSSCRHPFAKYAAALEAASRDEAESEVTLALNRLSLAFAIWAKVSG